MISAMNIQHDKKKAPPLVSVIITNWNGLALLKPCLAALSQQTFQSFEIIVIDNGSCDGSVAWLQQQSNVRLIANATNCGFAEANNQGIRASGSSFVALLNNDTEVVSGWLEALLAPMDDSNVGMVASLMYFASRPTIVQSAGIAIDRAAIAWDRFGGQPITNMAVHQPTDIFGPSAGAALYRRTMLDQIGLLDERFFAYLEDVDLAWRAQRAGWRCRYAPDAVVYHHTSATAGEGSPFKQRLLARNKIWLVAKNAPLYYLPQIIVYDLMAVLWALLRRRNTHHLVGRLNGLKTLTPFLRSRSVQGFPRHFQPLSYPWRISARYEHIK